jgi:hypothetical protein
LDVAVLNDQITFFPKCRTTAHLDDTILSASTPTETYTATPTNVLFLYVINSQALLGQTFTREP